MALIVSIVAGLATVAGLAVAALWLVGGAEPVFRIGRGGPFWFVAVRWREGRGDLTLAEGIERRWAARPDFGFVGPADPYWHLFALVAGSAEGAEPVVLAEDVEDALVLRVKPGRPPRIAVGLLRCLTGLGVLRPPTGAPAEDLSGKGFRAEVMPDAGAIRRLLDQPADYAPAMLNLLQYHATARYETPRPGAAPVTGATAYRRYGVVALRTVYRTGGHLVFFAPVEAVVRAAAAGPAAGTWDEVAVMQYDRPEAILTMEHAPDYLAALVHRDAGLQRSIVTASTPRPR